MTSSGAPLPFRRIGIVGLGLIGGSLARALRDLPNPPDIAASSLNGDELDAAVRQGVVQQVGTPERVAADSELVVYATPPDVTLGLLEVHAARWRGDTLVMDVASVKRPVMERARALGLGARVVGSHPMAGGERAGFAAARADLFAGARVWLTTVGPEAETAVRAAESFWRALGAQPARIEAERHDRLVAWTSHLPQISASALAAAIAGSGYAADALGPGGRDATRLAESPTSLWEQILLANADLLEEPLVALEDELGRLIEAVRARDTATIREIFRVAAQWRGS